MDRDVQRHPIRGIFWGLLFGVGLYLLLLGRKVVAFGEWMPLIIAVVAGVVINVLWATFAPAKKAKPPKGYTGAPMEPATVGGGQWSAAPPPIPEPAAMPEPPPPPVPDSQ